MPNTPRAAEPPADLRDREDERAVLDGLIAAARAGESGALVLWGEAGIGKTALLDYLVASASGLRVVRAVGVESEIELAFAGLHQLCTPMLDHVDRLPEPQRESLEIAFGLVKGPPPDLFFVGLAALSLLSEAAEEQPVLCVVDDAQWLDRASARVLAFVARRLFADPVALVFATRELTEDLQGLPDLQIPGLSDEHSRALLGPVVRLLSDERQIDRMILEMQGNPLALVELPRGLTATEWAGGLGVVGSQPLSRRIEESFVRRVERLSEEARILLLVAAAEPTGDPLLVLRAAEQLGVEISATAHRETDGLLGIDQHVTFRHPLVRSAIYRSAADEKRRSAHRALAEVTDRESNPDQRAWHLAAAANGPDEAIAAELGGSAGRAQARGGFGAAAALLERSVALSGDSALRTERRIGATQARVRAGHFEPALRLLAAAQTGALDDQQRAHLDLLRAQIALYSRRSADAPTLFLRAARSMEPLDPTLARETYLDAWGAAMVAGRFARGGNLHDVSLAARAALSQVASQGSSDLLLDGLTRLVLDGRRNAAPILREAASHFAGDQATAEESLRWGSFAGAAAAVLLDYGTGAQLAARGARNAREAGALPVLVINLAILSQYAVLAGELDRAKQLLADALSVAEVIGAQFPLNAVPVLAAFRGRAGEDLDAIDVSLRNATAERQGLGVQNAHWARSIVLNALGRYEEALPSAQDASEDMPALFLSGWALSEMVEAAARTGNTQLARTAVARLEDNARAGDTDWGVGIATRSRALVSDEASAERLYCEAIDLLGRTPLRPELARSHLLYGEWLRRQFRRVDARGQLHIAHELFAEMGMEAFAERARGELLATGERVRKRAFATRDELTAQEHQVAVLARDGLSNPEIARRLFLSRRTVEWHLRNVYGKLGISARAELAEALPGAQSELASG
ncbi:MAG TPA: AAA family ATPase [Solirubrobacteraceae bacterium]|nr:AAA family ATPase [Solirubrobacteraceae bacterium]